MTDGQTLSVVTVCEQRERVFSDGARRITPIYVRAVDKASYEALPEPALLFSDSTAYRVTIDRVSVDGMSYGSCLRSEHLQNGCSSTSDDEHRYYRWRPKPVMKSTGVMTDIRGQLAVNGSPRRKPRRRIDDILEDYKRRNCREVEKRAPNESMPSMVNGCRPEPSSTCAVVSVATTMGSVEDISSDNSRQNVSLVVNNSHVVSPQPTGARMSTSSTDSAQTTGARISTSSTDTAQSPALDIPVPERFPQPLIAKIEEIKQLAKRYGTGRHGQFSRDISARLVSVELMCRAMANRAQVYACLAPHLGTGSEQLMARAVGLTVEALEGELRTSLTAIKASAIMMTRRRRFAVDPQLEKHIQTATKAKVNLYDRKRHTIPFKEFLYDFLDNEIIALFPKGLLSLEALKEGMGWVNNILPPGARPSRAQTSTQTSVSHEFNRMSSSAAVCLPRPQLPTGAFKSMTKVPLGDSAQLPEGLPQELIAKCDEIKRKAKTLGTNGLYKRVVELDPLCRTVPLDSRRRVFAHMYRYLNSCGQWPQALESSLADIKSYLKRKSSALFGPYQKAFDEAQRPGVQVVKVPPIRFDAELKKRINRALKAKMNLYDPSQTPALSLKDFLYTFLDNEIRPLLPSSLSLRVLKSQVKWIDDIGQPNRPSATKNSSQTTATGAYESLPANNDKVLVNRERLNVILMDLVAKNNANRTVPVIDITGDDPQVINEWLQSTAGPSDTSAPLCPPSSATTCADGESLTPASAGVSEDTLSVNREVVENLYLHLRLRKAMSSANSCDPNLSTPPKLIIPDCPLSPTSALDFDTSSTAPIGAQSEQHFPTITRLLVDNPMTSSSAGAIQTQPPLTSSSGALVAQQSSNGRLVLNTSAVQQLFNTPIDQSLPPGPKATAIPLILCFTPMSTTGAVGAQPSTKITIPPHTVAPISDAFPTTGALNTEHSYATTESLVMSSATKKRKKSFSTPSVFKKKKKKKTMKLSAEEKRMSFEHRFNDDFRSELSKKIFDLLSIKDKLVMECVCKEWRRLIHGHQKTLTILFKAKAKDSYICNNSIPFHTMKEFNDCALQLVAKYTNLQHLELVGCQGRLHDISAVVKVVTDVCPLLERVQFWGFIDKSTLALFGRRFGRQLKSLDINSGDHTLTASTQLQHLLSPEGCLERLSIYKNLKLLKTLAPLPQLRHLDDVNIHDWRGLEAVTTVPEYREQVTGITFFADRFLRKESDIGRCLTLVAMFGRLEYLEFYFADNAINNKFKVVEDNCPQLKTLHLTGNRGYFSLKRLRHFRHLRELGLFFEYLDVEKPLKFRDLQGLELRELWMNCDITADEFCATFQNMTSLRTLHIKSNHIHQAQVCLLVKRVASLRTVYLEDVLIDVTVVDAMKEKAAANPTVLYRMISDLYDVQQSCRRFRRLTDKTFPKNLLIITKV